MTRQSSGQETQVLAFDIYGTLLDTRSITTAIQSHLHISEGKANELSLSWRKYQLEYTWRLNSMDLFEPFHVVTKNSLLHAASESHISIDGKTCAILMDSYNQLTPFNDALPALQALAQYDNIQIVIFSNGSLQMVNGALQDTPLAAIPHTKYLADAVQRYKPAPQIYEGLVAHADQERKAGQGPIVKSNVWLVSGNPFDITGARAAGLQAIWVDRPRVGWLDRVAPEGMDLAPTKIVNNLGEIANIMSRT